jgi:hypothetical protein
MKLRCIPFTSLSVDCQSHIHLVHFFFGDHITTTTAVEKMELHISRRLSLGNTEDIQLTLDK